VEKKLPTMSIGKSTHQDLVKKCGLRRCLRKKSVFLVKNLACSACFSQKILVLIILGCIWFDVSYSVYQFIDGENDVREAFNRSASVDKI